MAAIMERADENLLPSVYKEVSEAFKVGPTDLGYLTFIRNFVQALASPLAGVLVLHYDRPTVLAMGTVCWGLSTAAVGVINGFGLAIVIPALQSFIADSYLDGARGTGFGLLSFVGNVVMAGQDFWGLPGWRCAFILMALSSLLIGFLVFMFVVDPRKAQIAKSGMKRLESDSWVAMKSVMKVRTFQIIALQGSSVHFHGRMVFLTMWFELIGFDHKSSAALISLLATGCAVGSFFGGFLGDRISRVYPHAGRVMCAQFSVFIGIPFSWFLLTVIPQTEASWSTFALTLLLMGLTISWQRTMIYAFDRAIEGSFSSLAAPAVGILSERIYGYGSTPGGRAAALSKGLLSTMAVPWFLCCLLYSPLYVTYERDQAAAKHAAWRKN
ncbi:unnamed protein product [Spirodela intermedia]|uniref:Uncharacterized protein n=1 Tax=Spirodela intermedia TaxID=51605 RepID=A0A7I8II74_SPIIN|nr:unnamed protein product [Spirodela intermedia]CAA6657552.1 unnamed protein product [Spirodela intermedia]